MKSDAELLAAAIAGGPEAFTPIIDRYGDAVFGIALSRLRNFHQAEDVAQDVFIAAFERLGNLRDPSRLGAWLRSVTIHHCIDHLRKEREGNAGKRLDTHPGSAATPQRELERMELREQVLAAIARLSKTQRETTTLFYINGYSVAEVAQMQEVPVGTVKRRLHDAREKLKTEMLGMVENVLKSEAPKDDFAKQVFEILCQYHPEGQHPYGHHQWEETIAELRRIGKRGIEGFIRALGSPHSPTRVFAAHMLQYDNASQPSEAVVQWLKEALTDPNRKVRRHAVEALLEADIPDERKHSELVPLIVPLLGDASKRVRRAAAYELINWAGDVPIDVVAKVLLRERDRESRKRQKMLLHAIVHNGERKLYRE